MNQSTETRTLRFAFIAARWHADIVDQARDAFVDEIGLRANGRAEVETYHAPGAFELPLAAQRLARTGRYDGVVGAAFVVDGGIYRHDFVADAVVSGLMRAQLDTDTPIFSVVLTPHNYQQTAAHDAFFRNHFRLKGQEAAEAALAAVALSQELAAA